MTKAERREPKRKTKQPEHDNQAAYFDILKLNYRKFPDLRFIFAIPNAAKRSPEVAQMMLKEGLKAGVWDLHLPFARRGYGGAWIENKFGDNKLSAAQIEFGEHFRRENYFTKVSYSVETSLDITEWYLGITLTR